MEPGDLQPLQNLIQLTTLNLQACFRLTGQSVCEFVREQPARDLIGRFLGTLAPLAGLSQLQTLNLSGSPLQPMKFEGQILNLCGNNQGAHPLADF